MVLLCDLGKITPSLGLNFSIFRVRGALLDGPSRLPSKTLASLGAPTRGPQTVGKHRTLGASLGGAPPHPAEEETLAAGGEPGECEGHRGPGRGGGKLGERWALWAPGMERSQERQGSWALEKRFPRRGALRMAAAWP